MKIQNRKIIGEQIEVEVKPHGNGAIARVPKAWLGYVARVEVVWKAEKKGE